jgi:hypothetical protein
MVLPEGTPSRQIERHPICESKEHAVDQTIVNLSLIAAVRSLVTTS